MPTFGLYDRLINPSSTSTLGLQGANIPIMPGGSSTSTLHFQYSINGDPTMANKPTPSILDLDGATPPKYLDNLPTNP